MFRQGGEACRSYDEGFLPLHTCPGPARSQRQLKRMRYTVPMGNRDVSFASLHSFESLRSHTVSGTRQVSRVCTQYLVRSPRSQPSAEPAHPCIPFTHCCLLSKRTHRLPLFMDYRALSLHTFALQLSRSSAYAYPPRGFGSKAEYRLLAELYQAGSSTRLYCVHRTGAPITSIIPDCLGLCHFL